MKSVHSGLAVRIWRTHPAAQRMEIGVGHAARATQGMASAVRLRNTRVGVGRIPLARVMAVDRIPSRE
jgi:hypothetical protein